MNMGTQMSTIQADIEARLADTEPDVEVLLAEIVGGRLVRLFIDHLGHRARVRTRGDHDGRRSFTGELLEAGDESVTVAAEGGVVSIAYSEIHRSNLLGD